jgi:tetratricopeptide (TPR) repeat protein
LAKRKPIRRKGSGGGPRGSGGAKAGGAKSGGVTVRRTTDGRGSVLVHPRGALERAEDLDEVREMLEAGEVDVALDELRWLVGGCSEFIEAHGMLGEIALSEGDYALARGHFGFAVQLGLKAIEKGKVSGPLPYAQPANRAFFEAGSGLATSLARLGMMDKAVEIVDRLLKLDPTDPLKLRAALDDVKSGGLPIVELGLGSLGSGSSAAGAAGEE